MRNDFNALTDARLERLEERTHRIEVTVTLISITILLDRLKNSMVLGKAVNALTRHVKHS